MKKSILTVALLISTISFSQDYRTKAQETENRKAADKAANEHINNAYTNNLPNASGKTSSLNSDNNTEAAANIEAWWKNLKADLANFDAKPLPGTTGGGFTEEQRRDFAHTGNRRRAEQEYVTSILDYYHKNLDSFINKIVAGNHPCETGDCKNGNGGATTDDFLISAKYDNGLMNGVTYFYIKNDPMIKYIGVTYKNGIADGDATVQYHDGTFENIVFLHNYIHGDSVLVFPSTEAFFFFRNHGKITGLLKHMHPDKTSCRFLYRDNEMFTMLRSEHFDFTYPSEKMYTGNYYLYIKEENLTKLFKDEGDGAFYSGEYRKNSDTPNGFGTRVWGDGDSFTGKISDGSPNGEGKFYWANGGIYEGAIKSGELEGEGTMSQVNGNMYSGVFKHGKKHGLGVYTRADGYKIVGKFKEDNVQSAKYYDSKNMEISSDQFYSNNK